MKVLCGWGGAVGVNVAGRCCRRLWARGAFRCPEEGVLWRVKCEGFLEKMYLMGKIVPHVSQEAFQGYTRLNGF